MNSVRQLIYYGLAIVSLKGISFLMMPFITHQLSVEAYGELNLLVSLAAVLSLVLSLGIAELLFRFYDEGEIKHQNDLMTTSFVITSCSAGLCCIIAGLCYLNSDVFTNPYFVPSDLSLLLLSLAGNLLIAIPLCLMRIRKSAFDFMRFSVLQGILQASLTYWFVSIGMGITGILLSGAVASCVIALVIVCYYRDILFNGRFSLPISQCKYMASITVSAMFLYALNGSENWFIAAKVGKESLAIYVVAAQFALITSIAFEPFRMWWYPQRFTFYKQSPKKAATGAVYGLEMATLIALGMMFFGPLVIDWLLPQSYQGSKPVLAILCLVGVLRTQTDLFNLGCFLTDTAKHVPAINGFCALLALITTYFAIHFYQVSGLLYSLILVAFIRMSLFWYISQRLAYLNYAMKHVLFCWGMLIITAISSTYEWSIISLCLGIMFVCVLCREYQFFQLLRELWRKREVKHV